MSATPTIEITHFPAGPDGKVILTALLPDGTQHTDQGNIVSAKARQGFAAAIAERAPAVERGQILDELDRIAAKAAAALAEQSRAPTGASASSVDPRAPLDAMPPEVRQAAEETLRDPELIRQIVDDIEALGVAGERELGATIYLTGTSRLLRKPLAAIVQGATASGKSFGSEIVSTLFPPEVVIHATQITPQALFHMPPGSLVHKLVFAGERSRVQNPETAEATRALREMLSSGRLSKLMPVKGSGGIETRLIEQDGPIAFVESTTLTKIFEEDANRCLLVQTDERQAQTRRIYRAIAAAHSGGQSQDAKEAILQRHHAMQRMLQQAWVVVPYARRLAELVPADRVEGRRAFGHLIAGISACALLHQYQRDRTTDGSVVASPLDYQIIKRLLDAPLSFLLGRTIPAAAWRLRERLVQRFGSDEFTTTEATRGESVSDRCVRDWLNALCEGGFLEQTQEPKGSRPARWRLLPVEPEDLGGADLPALELVFPGDDFRPSNEHAAPQVQGHWSEVACAAGTVPTIAPAALEACRQSGVVPTSTRESPSDALVGTPEASPGRAG